MAKRRVLGRVGDILGEVRDGKIRPDLDSRIGFGFSLKYIIYNYDEFELFQKIVTLIENHLSIICLKHPNFGRKSKYV